MTGNSAHESLVSNISRDYIKYVINREYEKATNTIYNSVRNKIKTYEEVKTT